MHEFLRRGLVFTAPVGMALLGHGAAKSRAVRFRFGLTAGVDNDVADDLSPEVPAGLPANAQP
jgi:hypothetical protein